MSIDANMTDHLREHTSSSDARPESFTVPDEFFRPKFQWYVTIRPLLDFFFGLIMLICLTPVILAAGIAVKLTSTGPIFYCQTRLGRHGRPFTMFKLRSMVHNAETLTGPIWATQDDPRTTRFGRFLRDTHIDEFPQLLNVVLGQMSLIGPRPERPEIARALKWEVPHFDQRLQVRPGITGLAQLMLPPDSTIEDVRTKFLSDICYIREVNPWLDLRVCLYTFFYLTKASWHGVRLLVSLPSPKRVEQKLAADSDPETVSMICGRVDG